MFQLGTYGGAKRLAGLTWGAEDLPAAIGATTSREADGSYTAPYQLARSLCLFGAAAAEVAPIETVYPAFRDLDGLAAYAARARRDGFTGMMAIHPDQVPVINAAFTPSRGRDRARPRGRRRVRRQSAGGRAVARRPDDRPAPSDPGATDARVDRGLSDMAGGALLPALLGLLLGLIAGSFVATLVLRWPQDRSVDGALALRRLRAVLCAGSSWCRFCPGCSRAAAAAAAARRSTRATPRSSSARR